MLERFSTQKNETKIFRNSIILKCDGADIQTFLTRVDTTYSQTKINDEFKFGLLALCPKNVSFVLALIPLVLL